MCSNYNYRYCSKCYRLYNLFLQARSRKLDCTGNMKSIYDLCAYSDFVQFALINATKTLANRHVSFLLHVISFATLAIVIHLRIDAHSRFACVSKRTIVRTMALAFRNRRVHVSDNCYIRHHAGTAAKSRSLLSRIFA